MPTNDFQELYGDLQQLAKTTDYSSIAQTLTARFDPTTKSILSKWKANATLDQEERSYVHLLSEVESSLVRHSLSIYNRGEEDQENTDLFSRCLFRSNQVKILEELVIFIRDEYSFGKDDGIVLDLIRMLDTRTLAYRLCFDNLNPPPNNLNATLKECLNHHRAKMCFDEITLPDITPKKRGVNQHRFFVGCVTFAVALFKKNLSTAVPQMEDKYIYRLAKFVRVILRRPNFEKNELNIYCLRGVLAFLSNCIPTEHWLQVINTALVDPNNIPAQQMNPFNVDFFSLLIYSLLGSKHLQKNATQSEANDEALLVDIALVFLDKWCYTSDDEESGETSKTLVPSTSNQVLHFLRSTDETHSNPRKPTYFRPYITAKYDRIRLVAFAVLVNVIDYQDFEKSNPGRMANELVDLNFFFLKRAESKRIYKGISLNLLFSYLFRFLVQDVVKKAAMKYLPDLVDYARKQEPRALQSIYRITTSSDQSVRTSLAESVELNAFLDKEAKTLFESNLGMQKLHEQIQANLKPPPALTEGQWADRIELFTSLLPLVEKDQNQTGRQAFISYCHKDKLMRQKLCDRLEQAKLYSSIWVDEKDMVGDMNSTIAQAICRSQVVFVLFSADYCESDICRRECNYAINKKIPTYYLFVQKDFKKSQVDWVEFLIANNLYYRIYQEGELEKLIKALTNVFNPSSTAAKPTPEVRDPQPRGPAGNKRYLSKRSLDQWTNEDVQEWCSDNGFTAWTQHLSKYDGKLLLDLYRTLSVDSQLSNFITINEINIIEVVRFRNKLGELANNPPITQSGNPPVTKSDNPPVTKSGNPSVTQFVHHERSSRIDLSLRLHLS